MEIFEKFYILVSKFNQKSKKPKYYGTEDLLYPAEVHLIEIIGAHKRITTTEIAKTLGITKGAVSQVTNKLIAKDLIVKEVSPIKANEVFIYLTKNGEKVFLYHREMHRGMSEKVNAELATLSPESRQALENIFNFLEDSLNEI